MTLDDLRHFLNNKGWKRANRGGKELWRRPGGRGIILKNAVRRQLKEDGFTF